MNQKKEYRIKLVSKEFLNSDTCYLGFECPEIARCSRPGQFVNISAGTVFLKRPFGIASVDKDNGIFHIGVKVVGKGTSEIAAFETGMLVEEGFKKAKKVDFRKYSYKGKIKVDELDLYSFETYEDKNVNEEIKNKIKKIIEDSINKGDIVNEKIEINENTSFWFSTFSAKYVRDTKEIERLNISGYLLMK